MLTPASYKELDVTFQQWIWGDRVIFIGHFLDLGHIAKWRPKNTGSILLVALATNVFFFLIYMLYKDTLASMNL